MTNAFTVLRHVENLAVLTRYCGIFAMGTTARRLHLMPNGEGQQRLNYSTSSQEIITSLDSKTGVAIMKLNSPPVNCMSSTLMQTFIDAMKGLEQDPKCAALVLASNIPNIFCAGWNFKEIRRPQKEKYENFYHTACQLWTSLYSTRLATVAAVNGSCPAMGCIIALCCDYRIMKTGKGTIGLNETHMGIPLVPWIIDLFVNAVGQRQAELGITRGSLYEAEEALHIGLVDEVASSEEEVLKQAIHHAELLARLPSEARHKSKMGLRQPLLDRHVLAKDVSERTMVGNITSDMVQSILDVYLQKLKTRK